MEDEAVIVRNRDELATLSIQGDPSLNDWVAPARLRRFRCLGAVTALHLIRHGILADGLSPCVVQVIANQGEIRALDQQFLKDFAPEVLQDILSWRELGVEGPINPLHRINTYICNFGGGVVVRFSLPHPIDCVGHPTDAGNSLPPSGIATAEGICSLSERS